MLVLEKEKFSGNNYIFEKNTKNDKIILKNKLNDLNTFNKPLYSIILLYTLCTFYGKKEKRKKKEFL